MGALLRIDRVGRRVLVDDHEIALTRREFDLLAFLSDHPGRVFTREELLEAVWCSRPEWQSISTVTEHVRRVRLKTGLDLVTAIRGIGYRYDPPSTTSRAIVDLTEPFRARR